MAAVPSMVVAVSPEMREKAAKVRNETVSMVARPVSTRLHTYFIDNIPSKKRGERGVKNDIRLSTLHSPKLSSCYAV